jgi:putative endonuclease
MFSKKNGTLYAGVTVDLIKRVYEHKNKIIKGFTEKYGVDKLGYYEVYNDLENAIKREKIIKKFYRKEKLELIERMNPDWEDLYEGLL